MDPITHAEAVKQKATERYLLGEMTAEQRETFEEHFFDCTDCAMDLRAAAAFLDEAKIQLPALTKAAPAAARPLRPIEKKSMGWLGWLKPAFAVPVFAALLLVIGYQNFSTIPSLEAAASEPRVLPWTSLHAGTRGEGHIAVTAQRGHGAVLLVDLPGEGTSGGYQLSLLNPEGKRMWMGTAAGSGPISLLIPGKGLEEGSYTLTVSGGEADSGKEIDRRVFDVHFER